MSHRCPSPGCKTDVPSSQYACRPHWFSIPKPLRDQLWAAYREHGQLSEEHIAAMEDCDEYLRREEHPLPEVAPPKPSDAAQSVRTPPIVVEHHDA